MPRFRFIGAVLMKGVGTNEKRLVLTDFVIFSADGKPALAGQNKVKQVVIPYRGAVIMPGGALLKPCVANLYIATDAFTVKE